MQLRPLPPQATAITVAYGDGVGPEVLEATLRVLREADVMLSIDTIEVGQRIYDMEYDKPLLPSAWEKLYTSKVLLQAPVANPEGTRSIHDELCYRMHITEGERHRLSEDIAADTHFGDHFALFTPVHGTMDDLAGKNEASPASMLFAAILMLSHIGQIAEAARIWRAMIKVLEAGESLGTREFADAVCEHLWDTY